MKKVILLPRQEEKEKEMKKLHFCIAALLVISVGLFASGTKETAQASASGNQSVTITFWDENAGPERTPYLKQIIEWYHESQDKVRVEYVGIPQSQAVEKMNVAIAANATPDIAGIQSAWLSGLIAQKALVNLDQKFSSWEDSANFDTGAINAVRSRAIDKSLYMLPTRVSYNALWYRIDRFAEAGMAAPDTWDEFFTAIEKLTDVSKGQYGYSMRGGSGSGVMLQIIMFAYAGNPEFFDANGKSALRDPAMLEFLTRYANIYNKYTSAGDVNYGYKEMVGAFDSGSANMIQHNLGSLAEHQKTLPEGTYGTVFFPKSVKGYYTSTVPSPAGYGIFENSKHKEEAWDFLKFIGSEKAISYWNEMIGEFPPRLDCLDHEWVVNANHLKNITAVMQSPDTVYVEVPQFLPEYNRILTEIVDPGFQRVLLKRMSPADFLDSWATAIETAYARYLANVKN